MWQYRSGVISGRNANTPRRTGGGGGSTSWVTVVSQPTLTFQDNSYNGYTTRVKIASAQLSNTGLSNTRVSIYGGTTEGFKIASAYLGMASSIGNAWDFGSAPTQILFSGGASTTATANSFVTSDTITFTVQAGKDLIVAAYCDDASNDNVGGSSISTTGWTYYWKNAADSSVVAPAAYSNGTTLGAAMVKLVEGSA